MALVKCAECGNDVSTFASSCPHCGMPMAPVGNDPPAPETKRICCPDGTCTGTIGENGLCRTCGANPATFKPAVPSNPAPEQGKKKQKIPYKLLLFIFAFVVVMANYYFGKNDLRTADTKKTELSTPKQVQSEPVSNSNVGQKWIIIGRRDDNSTYQYDKNSIKKISHNIYEVYEGQTTYKSQIVTQVRIDCEKKKYAQGKSDGWVYGKKSMSMDFSKNGWLWFDADGWGVDLVDIVCSDVASPTADNHSCSHEEFQEKIVDNFYSDSKNEKSLASYNIKWANDTPTLYLTVGKLWKAGDNDPNVDKMTKVVFMQIVGKKYIKALTECNYYNKAKWIYYIDNGKVIGTYDTQNTYADLI